MRVLVTGAAGFAGSHLVEELVRRWHDVTALDSLTYAGALENLRGLRCRWICHDFTRPLPPLEVDAVIHNGGETHVDRSLISPRAFVEANVIGTMNLLEFARRTKLSSFVYVSTDEVFGGAATECEVGERLQPSNPYAASKAAGEYIARSYQRSFGVPTIVTRSCNLFGPRQHPEKFVPKVIGQLLRGETVEIHTSLSGKVGARRWCPVETQARALACLAENGIPGQTYHVTEGEELTNLMMAQLLAKHAGRELNYVLKTSPRPSYDERYDLKLSRHAVAWRDTMSFDDRVRQTVAWYQERMA